MLLDSAVQDSPCVGSVGGTEVKSSQSIESSLKKKQLCKVKVKPASPQEWVHKPCYPYHDTENYYIFSNAYLHPAILGLMEEIGNSK